MTTLITALFLSVAANRLVEAVAAPLRKKYPTVDMFWLVYVAWLIGGVLSYVAGVNLFTDIVPNLPPVVGLVLTALVVGGGSNLIHDIVDRPPTNTITATSAGPLTATVRTDSIITEQDLPPGQAREWPPRMPDRPVQPRR